MNGTTILTSLINNKQQFRLLLSFSTSPLLSHSSYNVDIGTCIAILQSCAHTTNLSKGKELHTYMLKSGFLSSPQAITSLINMYSKCTLTNHALKVFNFPTHHDKNVFAYNAIIAGFVANGLSKHGFGFYRQMRHMGIVPDKYTFPCVIRACGDAVEDFEAKKIHGLLFKFGLELDVFVGSALVNTYLKFGLVVEAHGVFDELPVRDVVLWNSMINGYAQIGRFEEALEVFQRMVENGIVPCRYAVTGVLSIFSMVEDFYNGRAVHGFVIKMGYDSGVVVLNSLIDMYGKCKCASDALNVFDVMDEKDIFSWNSIISVHERCGDHYGTLRLFDRMLGNRVQPDLVTVTAVLPACTHLAALMHGREIHGYMIVNGLGKDGNSSDFDDVQLNNALMDMYAKCGNMRDARVVFDHMREKDVASWNIMITGYGMHGYGDEALDTLSRMRQAQMVPNEVSFVGLLSACSHAGMVKEGLEFLAEMESKYAVSPSIEHYTCVIDMLCRAGKLMEAYDLVLAMPFKADPVGWRALLAACRQHKDTDLAEIAASKVIELEPGHCGNYVLMSNVYGVVGRYEEVSKMRHTMKQQNVKKRPGCSWIELMTGVHVFITGDRTHPQTGYIYAGLNSLTAVLHEHGYVPLI
ncbi:PREDICTED: pentatricopeptide repeat-containing protein At3g14730 [Lupinus angustifolius]|uniref:pentatricopeptide repeat-containing protein At3g14730 n=1 Tax=Lupinus angustifolius TaxID=3871 RepID=UPI00092E6A3A|nr:PREDICTED: pentatricopeptide repeat-containing protein At3g14730 [Lupinus angustifolius]